ncbi:MAG: IS30 family transposase, partial [Gammaproteobacteria bacterium]
KKYNQLTSNERHTIAFLQREGKKARQIGAALGRSTSTITREIKRNSIKTKGYDPAYAQVRTSGRRWRGSKLERQPALRTSVLDLLTMGWSPQIIAGKLAREKGCNVISHESIYRFVYAQIKRSKDYKWRHYLPRGKSKRGWRGVRGGSPALRMKHRVSIRERPHYIAKRASAGHWEADLMLFSIYGQSILIAQERYSRMIVLFLLKNKEAKTVLSQLTNLFDCLPTGLSKTITFDNGTEFAEHHQLNKAGIKTYFCDVKSPWQKGGVENAIGRLRRFLPRKTDISTYTASQLEEVGALYNHTPRKCLDYQTPAEVFRKQLLHLKCELTFPPTRE